MASKPKTVLKTTSKAAAKVVDIDLSAQELKEKTDFMENHVGHAKPLLSDAVIKQMGGWTLFSMYAHDASECGVDLGFKGFSKESECKVFFSENKKLLKDFYKPKTAKAKKEAEQADLLGSLNNSIQQPFSETEIAEIFGSKAKVVVENEPDTPLLVNEDYDDVDMEVKQPASVKQDIDITVWLARNAAQHMVDAYSYLHSDRYEADIVAQETVVDELDEDLVSDEEDIDDTVE